jgi:GNAT superfamily N-acetyltransferase
MRRQHKSSVRASLSFGVAPGEDQHRPRPEPDDASRRRGFRSVQRAIWRSAPYRKARRIAADLARPFVRLEIAYIFRLDLTLRVKIIESDADITITQASADDIERAILPGRPDQRRREDFRWRLENGCLCFVAHAGSTLVAYNWVRLRPGVDDGDMIALAGGEAFHLDSYVDENWRGHRIEGALSSRMRLYEQEQGCAVAFTKISVFNRKSLRSSRRMGWQPSGLVLRVRGSRSGGWPIVTLWGSAYPLRKQ